MRIRGAVLEEIGRPAPYAGSRPISVAELELDDPGPGELLVRIEAAGLCHSDLSVVDGNRVRPTPMLLGHEAAGVVEATGPGTTLQPGDRAIMTFLPRCGDCAGCATDGVRPCVTGSASNNEGTLLGGGRRLRRVGHQGPEDLHEVHHHLGVSGFATHAVVDERSVVPVDDDVPAEVAALMGCAVLTGGGAVLNVLKPYAGSSLAVVGLGGVGMAAVLTAAAHEGVDVLAIDPFGPKRELAAELGATALTPEEATERQVRADLVVEAAGNARAFEAAVALTAPGGTTCSVGLPAPDARAQVSPLGLVAEGRTIVGSYLGSAVPRRDIPTFLGLWRDGRLPVEKLVSGHLALDEVNAGMDALADGSALRQILHP